MTELARYRVSLPRYTLGEEVFNAVSHGIGAIAGIAGGSVVALAAILIIILWARAKKRDV